MIMPFAAVNAAKLPPVNLQNFLAVKRTGVDLEENSGKIEM
jgi:hypothetical protein